MNLYHFNDDSWNEDRHNLTDLSLFGSWRSSETDIHAVGSDGIIMHYGCLWEIDTENGLFVSLVSTVLHDLAKNEILHWCFACVRVAARTRSE